MSEITKLLISEKEVEPHLNKLLPDAGRNFDLKDYDIILRIDSNSEDVSELIIVELKKLGFPCVELFN